METIKNLIKNKTDKVFISDGNIIKYFSFISDDFEKRKNMIEISFAAKKIKEQKNTMKNISYKQKIYGRISSKPYNAQFTYNNTLYYCGCYATEREAKIALDRKRLSLGLEPMYLKRLSIS